MFDRYACSALAGILVFAWTGSARAQEDAREENAGQAMKRLSPEGSATLKRALDKGARFLERTQQGDGGWRAFEGSDAAITALAGRALARHPDYGPKHPVVRRAMEFVLKSAQENGGIYPEGAGLDNYYTSVAVMFLSELEDGRAKEAVGKAVKYLTALQWDEAEDYQPSHVFYGGAGYGKHKRPDMSNTQMMLEALHQSGLSPEHPVYKRALIFISRSQMLPKTNDQPYAMHGDGGFIYSPANGGESKAGEETVDGHTRLRTYGSMTYAGFKSLLYAGLDEKDPRVRAAVDWIRQHYTLDSNPNMPGSQSKEGLYYYYHVFSRALDAWGEEVIDGSDGARHVWRDDLIEKLASLQREDGSWVNEEDRWWESNPHLVTAYAMLALENAGDSGDRAR
jgi:squalene-hopene/tetraprenyl-beta-curcumene cyclase